jgi:hypothetical protein
MDKTITADTAMIKPNILDDCVLDLLLSSIFALIFTGKFSLRPAFISLDFAISSKDMNQDYFNQMIRKKTGGNPFAHNF